MSKIGKAADEHSEFDTAVVAADDVPILRVAPYQIVELNGL